MKKKLDISRLDKRSETIRALESPLFRTRVRQNRKKMISRKEKHKDGNDNTTAFES